VWLSALRAGRPLHPRKIPGTHFCQRLSRPQEHSAAGRIRSIEESNDIGNRTRDLPACDIVTEPTTLSCASIIVCMKLNSQTSMKYYINQIQSTI
jgi:hypothetical protein